MKKPLKPQEDETLLVTFGLMTCMIYRLCCLFTARSAFVPDEYWQSLEVAHRLEFGYGYLTWEWVYGIRSYIYVAFIKLFYMWLRFWNLDNRLLVAWAPRILQALVSAFSDMVFVLWIKKQFHECYVKCAIFLYFTNFMISYCYTRTLTNTIETNLTIFATMLYPWRCGDNGNGYRYLWFVGISCLIRPTCAIIWLPLCFYSIVQSQDPIRVILKEYFQKAFVLLLIGTLVDSYFHGKWVLTWWNFFYYNVYENVSANYSVHPFYWYIVYGIPILMGPSVIPFYMSLFKKILYNYPNDLAYNRIFYTVIFTVTVYSFIPHKEFRFLLPLTPFMVYISSSAFNEISHRKKWVYYRSMVLTTITTINGLIFLYIGFYHQIGTINVMSHLAIPNASLLFLMPCHSTPLYSHLHVNVSTRFLRCEPNLSKNDSYIEEADLFYQNPGEWLQREYPPSNLRKLPSHIIFFDVLLPKIQHFLNLNHYKKHLELYHAFFVTPPIGKNVLVYTLQKG